MNEQEFDTLMSSSDRFDQQIAAFTMLGALATRFAEINFGLVEVLEARDEVAVQAYMVEHRAEMSKISRHLMAFFESQKAPTLPTDEEAKRREVEKIASKAFNEALNKLYDKETLAKHFPPKKR